MSIRTLSWVVADDMSVTPTAIQRAGVQGDDRATCVEFAVPAALQSGYDLYIEFVNAMGEFDKTDSLPLVYGKVSFLLPLAWTQDGGNAELHLVAVERVAEDAEPVTIYSKKCRVVFAERYTGFKRVQALLQGSIHRLMDVCEKVANRVEEITANIAENVKGSIAERCYRIIEQNHQVATGLWFGTNEEYAAYGSKLNNTLCIIIDGDITPIEKGGTGADTKEDALKNLGVNDYPIEEGTSGSWSYCKWKSGASECWGRFDLTGIPRTTAVGALFYTDKITIPENFPIGIFNDVPYTTFVDVQNANWSSFVERGKGTTKETIGEIYLGGVTSKENINASICIYAKGFYE